jgi:hypothetical protein
MAKPVIDTGPLKTQMIFYHKRHDGYMPRNDVMTVLEMDNWKFEPAFDKKKEADDMVSQTDA